MTLAVSLTMTLAQSLTMTLPYVAISVEASDAHPALCCQHPVQGMEHEPLRGIN